jgi:2',3'-cyclic-nucleotide 2'-phosphodiesterase (5'-nucleotidase family)
LTDHQRRFLPPLAELIDRLAVDQIKELTFRDGKEAIRDEMKSIEHDIDVIIAEKSIKLDARIIRVIIALAQLNLHIWRNKDDMEGLVDNQGQYLALLKLSHQLNGIRNQLKNHLLVIGGDKDAASLRSNFNTDGLDGWDISI